MFVQLLFTFDSTRKFKIEKANYYFYHLQRGEWKSIKCFYSIVENESIHLIYKILEMKNQLHKFKSRKIFNKWISLLKKW